MMFSKDDDNLLSSDNSPQDTMKVSGIKRKVSQLASPTKTATLASSSSSFSSLSPASDGNHGVEGALPKMTPSPVKSTLITTKWIQSVVLPLPSRPSAELEQFFSSFGNNLIDEVIYRANILVKAIFPSSDFGHRFSDQYICDINLMDSSWTEQRRVEALKLYYKILESICTSEAQKLNARDVRCLLDNERFHRCMLSCSAELISVAHAGISTLFPLMLERVGISAFDLCKVIESFIKHIESLPRELRRHLNSLEEKLLESMVWKKGSSLYNLMIVARPTLSTEINQLGLLSEAMPSLDAIAMDNQLYSGDSPETLVVMEPPGRISEKSTKRARIGDGNKLLGDNTPAFCSLQSKSLLPSPSLQSAFASPTQQNPQFGEFKPMDTPISVLFHKMEKLAAFRINRMAERLQLSQHVKERIYFLFQQILTQKTFLFFNRHVDQIILCCFYVVSKVSKLELNFEEIKACYMKQPHSIPQVFHWVYVKWPSATHNGKNEEDHVGIIQFYNDVFRPSVTSLMNDIGSAEVSEQVSQLNKNGDCPGTPRISPFFSLPDLSPKKVSPSQNVYLSPLQPSKKEALISRMGKSYYAYVGVSTRAESADQSPSKDLTDINKRLNGTRVRRSLNFDNVDVHFISDSLVVESFHSEGKLW
ncbi:Retinoblastoma-related protein [Quillaja saponaria]|uniref:Retinoblastoma-related protein n=1 Tax=Quillaja saponaria TaxID=32244 RepID=A0AAD7Q7I6_QUISA|nr:Retinoblastoma-related protein [Quillaja saponaria]